VRDLDPSARAKLRAAAGIKKKEAVVLFGQKARRQPFTEHAVRQRESRKNQYTNERLANESAAQRDVTARGLLEPAVEPAKESSSSSPSHRSLRRHFGLQRAALSRAVRRCCCAAQKKRAGTLARFFAGSQPLVREGHARLRLFEPRTHSQGARWCIDSYGIRAGGRAGSVKGCDELSARRGLRLFFLNFQLPPAAFARADGSGRAQDRNDTQGDRRRRLLHPLFDGFSLLNRISVTYNGFFFVALRPWNERKHTSQEILKKRQRWIGRGSARGDRVRFSLRPFRGWGTRRVLILAPDRSGGSAEFLDQNLQKFLAAARQRPELAGVFSQFSRTRRSFTPMSIVDKC